MFAAAPEGAKRELAMATHRSAEVCYLACKGVPAAPFNRAFAIAPQWASNMNHVSEGLKWLDRHASCNWVVQIDEEDYGQAAQALGRHGLIGSPNGWMKLVRTSEPPAIAVDKQIARVDCECSARDFGEVVVRGFGFPRTTLAWFEALTRQSGWTCYVAYDEDRAIAACAMYVSGRQSWFGIDTTLEGCRCKGVQQALIGRRLRDAAAADAAFIMAETGRSTNSPDPYGSSFRNYQRMGFEAQYYSANFVRNPDLPRSANPVLML